MAGLGSVGDNIRVGRQIRQYQLIQRNVVNIGQLTDKADIRDTVAAFINSVGLPCNMKLFTDIFLGILFSFAQAAKIISQDKIPTLRFSLCSEKMALLYQFTDFHMHNVTKCSTSPKKNSHQTMTNIAAS